MKTKVIKIVVLIGMLLVGQFSWAQVPSNILSENEKKELEIKVKYKLDDFLTFLSQIGNKNIDSNHKDKAVKSALDLFIGKGYDYYAEDEWGRLKKHDAVTMQTTNKYGRVYSPKKMVDYLKNMRNLRYEKIDITSAAAVRVDNITPTGKENQFKAVAYYYQRFYGKTAEGYEYIDYTCKKVTVNIERVQIPTPDGTTTTWKVQLGDITAKETH